MDSFPVHHLKLMGVQDICLVEPGLGELFMRPVSQSFPFIRSEFIAAEEHTDWLQREPPGGDILRSVSVINGALSMIVHLTVELGFPREVVVCPFIILVRPDMRVESGKSQPAAVNHDVLKDIGVAALGRDAVWGEISHFC